MNEHLLKRNEEVYRKLGIPAWHAAGITGAGVTVAVLGYGGCLAAKKPYLANVNTPWEGRGSYHDGDEIIHAVAPGAHIYGINIFRGGWNMKQALEWLAEHPVDVVCTSIRYGGWDAEKEELSRELYERGVIMIDSADNQAAEDIGYPAASAYWFAVGAYDEQSKGPAGYSSWGRELDCLMYTDLAVEAKEGYHVPISHTSGAVQCVAGMAALLKEWLKITPPEFREFLRQNCVDIGVEGWDAKSGFGLFVLPDPATLPGEEGAEMKPDEFIALVKPGAIESYKKYGILPSITIAQAALESGWGKYNIHNNLFGIKWTEGCGYEKVARVTTEYINGAAQKVTAYFRGYTDFGESILDHAKLLATARYQKVRQATDYKEAAKALQECGYATDPNYASKLIFLISAYELWKIDEEVKQMFKDVPNNHWAKADIEAVVKARLMSGYPDGRFGPDEPVTRAQLAAVLARLLMMLNRG